MWERASLGKRIDQSRSREVPAEESRAAKDLDPETDLSDIPFASADRGHLASSRATPRSWHFCLPAGVKFAIDLLDTVILETSLPGSVACRHRR